MISLSNYLLSNPEIHKISIGIRNDDSEVVAPIDVIIDKDIRDIITQSKIMEKIIDKKIACAIESIDPLSSEYVVTLCEETVADWARNVRITTEIDT
tara:strand:- start:314 stop:604 length:291 start_codon:yes stop_codon:yes gene_type:complete